MCEISNICVMKSMEKGTYIIGFSHDGSRFSLPISDTPWRLHPTRFDVVCEISDWCKGHCQTCRDSLRKSGLPPVEPFTESFVPTVEDFEDIVDNNDPDNPIGNYSTEDRCGVFHDVWYSPWRHGHIRTEVAEFSRDPGRLWKLVRHFHPENGLQNVQIEQVVRGRPIPHWVWKKEES